MKVQLVIHGKKSIESEDINLFHAVRVRVFGGWGATSWWWFG